MKREARSTHSPNGAATAQPSPNGQPSKRERILSAALKLFAHEPYQAVTMDRVAQGASVAKGTLYLYFPSKESLYLGILTEGMEAATRNYQSNVDPNADVRERLLRAISLSVEFYDQRRDFLRLFATEEPRLAEARSRILDEWRDRGQRFFSSLIQEGMNAGVFVKGDPRLATLMILGSIRSVLLYYGSGRPVSELSNELGRLVIRSLVNGRTVQPSRIQHSA
jgi:AcrR family transcriptional regulator